MLDCYRMTPIDPRLGHKIGHSNLVDYWKTKITATDLPSGHRPLVRPASTGSRRASGLLWIAGLHRSSPCGQSGTAHCRTSWVMVPAQAIVGQFLQTFKDYPPRAKSGSFSLDQLSQKMQEGAKRLVSCLAITIRQRSEASRGRHQCSRGSFFPRLRIGPKSNFPAHPPSDTMPSGAQARV